MAKQLGTLAKTLKDYSGVIASTGIVAVTGAIEQLVTLASYRCPCVSLAELGPNCTDVLLTESGRCSNLLNIGYGLSFIIAPAIGLFLFGMVSNPKMWKTCTGFINKIKRFKRDWVEILKTVSQIAAKATIAPITWVAIALLDGRFLACAITPLPYDIGRPTSQYDNCEKVAIASKVYNSDDYLDKRSFSQVVGWILVSVLAIAGMIAYTVVQCVSPLTYYHAKYYKLYRAHEENEFNDEMNKKAQKDSEANVLKFMEKRRSKEIWDRISSVYDFQRDDKSLALYSYLHDWVLEEKKKEKKKEETSLAAHSEENGANLASEIV
ncbi:calcium homeostasis modulator protein 6-like [Clavelina lepadiformis]|uniref:calcium homeostasis modulator protein 6-like n=1 Tax=Clavelina lepadiformis TaxID=159417 RepID=UPI004041E504